MSSKSRNIEKVKSMLKGTYVPERKIQVATHIDENVHEGRKIGETWEDSDGVKWEQKNGYRMKVSKLADRGIADKCNTCEYYIIKEWDKQSYNGFGNCMKCQIDFESKLKLYPIKYNSWVRLMELNRMDSINAEFEKIIFEKSDEISPFDMTIVNAIANENRKDGGIKL
tara:strand:+ start:100 stop:606 length:507 start_codon:yes stop_codon:yes gene_type:complete